MNLEQFLEDHRHNDSRDVLRWASVFYFYPDGEGCYYRSANYQNLEEMVKDLEFIDLHPGKFFFNSWYFWRMLSDLYQQITPELVDRLKKLKINPLNWDRVSGLFDRYNIRRYNPRCEEYLPLNEIASNLKDHLQELLKTSPSKKRKGNARSMTRFERSLLIYLIHNKTLARELGFWDCPEFSNFQAELTKFHD